MESYDVQNSEYNVSSNYDLDSCYVELTSNCNLRCKHCYNESGTIPQVAMTPKAFENIISSFSKNNSSAITLSGGEPLLNPYIYKYIDMVKSHGFEKCLMITNATLIDHETALKLTAARINIQISLNGSSSATHDQLCGQGSFEKTMRGLQNLLDLGYEDYIVVRCTLTKINLHDINNFMSLIVKCKIPKVSISLLTSIGRAKNNQELLTISDDEYKEIIDFFKKDKTFKELSTQTSVDFPDEDVTGGCPLIINKKNIPFSPKIDAFGNVYICQIINNSLYSIGNVNDNTLLDIIKSDKMNSFIWFLRLGTKYMPDCKECIWQSTCGKGCIAESLSKGSIQETDGKCNLRKKMYLKDFLTSKGC